jgi:hypothetical protein
MHDLEHALRQSCRFEAFRETLGAQRRLRRMLEMTALPAMSATTVHRDQERVVPGRDGEDHTQRFTAHEAGEIRLRSGVEIRQRGRGNGNHVARPFERAAHFVGCVARRAAHLPGQFLGDLRRALLEFIAEQRQYFRAFGQRDVAPGHLGATRGAQDVDGIRPSRRSTYTRSSTGLTVFWTAGIG